jgi:hypothetical protein
MTCYLKQPRVSATGLLLYLPAYAEHAITACVLSILLVTVSTTLNYNPDIRRNWRLIRARSYVFSAVGYLFWFLRPGSDFAIFGFAISVCALIDPRLDVRALTRGYHRIGALKTSMAFSNALFHHIGCLMIMVMVWQLAETSPNAELFCLPIGILVAAIAQPIDGTVIVGVIMRVAPKWFRCLQASILMLQAAALALNIALSYSDGVQSEFTIPLSIMIAGNVLAMACMFADVPISTHENAEQSCTSRAFDSHHRRTHRERSVARAVHDIILQRAHATPSFVTEQPFPAEDQYDVEIAADTEVSREPPRVGAFEGKLLAD